MAKTLFVSTGKEPVPIPPPQKDHVIQQAQWDSMKEDFIELIITGKTPHWPTLAAKYGKDPQQARNKAYKKGWHKEVEKRRQAREAILEAKMTSRTEMALDELNKDFMTSELAIRKRHATMARGLQVRAARRIQEFDMSKATLRDALAMLKMGLEEERNAMGLTEIYEGKKSSLGDETPEGYKPVVQQMGGHQRVKEVSVLLLKGLQALQAARPHAVEAGIVQDVIVKDTTQPPSADSVEPLTSFKETARPSAQPAEEPPDLTIGFSETDLQLTAKEKAQANAATAPVKRGRPPKRIIVGGGAK